MAQYGRPIQDISTGLWTDEGSVDNDGSLYTSLDESSQDGDDSYVSSVDTGETFEVKLGPFTDPEVSTGHIVHIFFRSIGSGGQERFNFYLMQGTTQIALQENSVNRSGSYANAAITLSAAEANSITDYTDLRIRVNCETAGPSDEYRVTQCYLEVPDPPTRSVNVSECIETKEKIGG